MLSIRESAKKIASTLHKSSNIVVLTGAGISAESGVPTFRGAGGLWRGLAATDLATPEAFARDPALVWQFYQYRRTLVEKCAPNAGHHALVAIEKMLLSRGGGEDDSGSTCTCKSKGDRSFTLLTQNVDGLHAAAGSGPANLLELHGSLWRVKPISHAGFAPAARLVWEDRTEPICPALAVGCGAEAADITKAFGGETRRNSVSPADLPHCPSTGEPLRPAVVWFGEALDESVLSRAVSAVEAADVLLVVGTSGVVYPAAGFGALVRHRGGIVAHFNVDAEAAGVADGIDVVLVGPSGETLTAVADELRRLVEEG